METEIRQSKVDRIMQFRCNARLAPGRSHTIKSAPRSPCIIFRISHVISTAVILIGWLDIWEYGGHCFKPSPSFVKFNRLRMVWVRVRNGFSEFWRDIKEFEGPGCLSKERRLRAFEQAIGDFSATTRCLLSVSFVATKILFERNFAWLLHLL